MRRRIFNTLAVLSAVMLVGVVAISVRSYRVTDKLGAFRNSFTYDYDSVSYDRRVISSRGVVVFEVRTYHKITRQQKYQTGYRLLLPSTPEWDWEHLSFGFSRKQYGYPSVTLQTRTSVKSPYWFPTLLTAILPALFGHFPNVDAGRDHALPAIPVGYRCFNRNLLTP